MRRRLQLIPWKTAGRVSEQFASADEVIRQTGWVFNNETGSQLTIDEFVATGDNEVLAYLEVFGLRTPGNDERTVVEIGCGIGRMTCAFTHEFSTVYACDLDAGFLERCRETVARFGKVDRLRTIEVGDGRSLEVPTDVADLAFSYITLQHCEIDDALELASESVRVVRAGGYVALNFRSRSGADALLLPAGALIRSLFRIPRFGRWLSQRRTVARFAWQANRLQPDAVIRSLPNVLTEVKVWRHPRSNVFGTGAEIGTFDGINPHHWWLVARIA
ncbi:MAG TPA: class I SAM-dependent methyltransferase [Ilumatobacteraceae bacterium]|nr:class I SAM-dependent methyltransferase [Ilumatobacteraceae bacterium]